MVEVKDIMDMVASRVQMLKQIYPAATGGKKAKDKVVDLHPTYSIGCSYADRVKVHAEIGDFPEKMFLERAPNLTDKEYNYIKGNFKKNTTPVYMDYHSTISRAFNDGGWSIDYTADANKYTTTGQTLQTYLESNIKKFGSLENFMKQVVIHLKAVDANGVIAIKPDDIYVTGEVDENGVAVFDNTKLFEPQPHYYRSDQIVAREIDQYYMVLLDERSLVEYGTTKQKYGFIFEFYDNTNIYKIIQVGKYTDFKFEIRVYFNHNWGSVPCFELKGVPQIIGNEIVWMPPFLYACDTLDLALMNQQYLQISIANSCFPYRVMVGSACTYEEKSEDQFIKCFDGYLDLPGLGRKTCPSCHGSGLKDRVSPMGVLLLSKEDWSGSGDKAFSDKAMYYVSPDVNALQFVDTKIDKDIDISRKILHLQTSNSKVKGSEDVTATGQGIDLKAMYAFIKPISDQIFDLYSFCVDAIGWMRYGEDYKAPTLSYPVTFDYHTEADYMEQIVMAQKAGLAPCVIHSIIYRYLSTLYFNEKKTAEVFTLIVHADRILTMSQDDINIKLSKGLVEKWESILHDSAITMVDELLDGDPAFFEKEFSVQKEMLIQKAKDKADSIASPIDVLRNAALGVNP